MEIKYLDDRRLSACLFAVVWLLYAIVYMTKNCYGAAMAAIVDEGVMTKSQTGLITALFYLVYGIFQVIGGFAADRYSPGKLILMGVIGAGVANLVIYLNQNYILMMVVWTLNGVVQFGVWPAVFKIVATCLSKEHRKMGIFFIGTAGTLGLVMSYICAAFVRAWQSNFLISAVMLFVSAAVWGIFWHSVEGKMVTETPEAPPPQKKLPREKSFMKLLLVSGVIFILVVAVIRNMLYMGIKACTPVMIMESYETVSPSLANGLNGIMTAVSVLGLILLKLLYPRFFREEVTLMTVLLTIMLLPMWVITRVGNVPVWLIVTALSVFTILMACSDPLMHYIASRFTRTGKAASISGLINAGASIGLVISNYGFAKMAELVGWRSTSNFWMICMAVAIALCIAARPFWRRFLRREEEIADEERARSRAQQQSQSANEEL